MIGAVIAVIVLLLIVGASLYDKEELKRLQILKNRRRFGGKKLPPADLQELDKLQRKYWWY
jgi:hypothetical protein